MKVYECGKRKSLFSCFHLLLKNKNLHGKHSWEKLYFSNSTYAWHRKKQLKELSEVSRAEKKTETNFIWLYLSYCCLCYKSNTRFQNVPWWVRAEPGKGEKRSCRVQAVANNSSFESSWNFNWRFHQDHFLNSHWHFAAAKLPQQIQVKFCPWQIKFFWSSSSQTLQSYFHSFLLQTIRFLGMSTLTQEATSLVCAHHPQCYSSSSPYQIRKPHSCFLLYIQPFPLPLQ